MPAYIFSSFTLTFQRELVDTNAFQLQPSLSEGVVIDGHGCHTALHFGFKAMDTRQSSYVVMIN